VSHEVPYHSIPLGEPRPLSAHERALLNRLLDDSAATPELRQQAEQATVSEICSCGYPSVTFAVPAHAPVARLNPLHPDVRHGADLTIERVATGPDGRCIQVNLHVLGGRLFELEIWAGSLGGDPSTELPDPSTLRM
jgi:hypothetical protein